MSKVRLGDLLVRAGVIKESDLRVALAQQKQHGGKLGEHLVRVNLVTEEMLARAVAQQLGIHYNDLSQAPPAAVTALVPQKIAQRLQILPWSFDPRTQTLSVVAADPLDDDLATELTRATGKNIQIQTAPAMLLRRAIEHAYFGLDVQDEGTSEFQLVDIHGRGKTVKVKPSDEEELPELGTSELMPVSDDEPEGGEFAPVGGAGAQQASPTPGGQRERAPVRIAPPRPQGAASASNDAGEEALRLIWALADVLIERGYFTRAELMKAMRK